jgi:hypothetical protein
MRWSRALWRWKVSFAGWCTTLMIWSMAAAQSVTIGEAGRLRASAIAACIATSSAWLAVSPSGCVPVDCSHAVPVVRCVHRRA